MTIEEKIKEAKQKVAEKYEGFSFENEGKEIKFDEQPCYLAYTNKNTTTSGSTTTKLTPNVSAGNTGSSSNGSTSGSVTKKNTQKSQTQQAYGTTLKRVNPKTGDYQQTAWYAGLAAAALAALGIAGKKNRKKEI